jgi:hypothetical protein
LLKKWEEKKCINSLRDSKSHENVNRKGQKYGQASSSVLFKR